MVRRLHRAGRDRLLRIDEGHGGPAPRRDREDLPVRREDRPIGMGARPEPPRRSLFVARSIFTTSFARIRATQSDAPSGETARPPGVASTFSPSSLRFSEIGSSGDEAIPLRGDRRGRFSLLAPATYARAPSGDSARPSHECGSGCLKRSFPEAASSRWSDWSSAPVQATTTRVPSGVSASANGYGETSVCVPVGVSRRPFGSWISPDGQARRHDAVGGGEEGRKRRERIRICLERKERTRGAYGED